MANYSEGRMRARSRRRRLSTAAILAITVIIAVICVAGTFLGIYISGIRYIKIDTSGGSYIKFFGKVDGLGAPYQGRLYYSDGTTAEVDMSENTVKYFQRRRLCRRT